MKRLSWLLFIVISSLGLVGFTTHSSPVTPHALIVKSSFDQSNPFTIVLPIPGYNIVCKIVGTARICASVSNKAPVQNSSVTVYGTLKINGVAQVNMPMLAVWHYKTVDSACNGKTNTKGLARCARSISMATIGYEVSIDVTINKKYTVTTSFTPKRENLYP